MSKQNTPQYSERKLKLAEAGVLFVIILGLIVAVGVKMGGQDGISPPESRTAAATPAAAPAPAVAELASAVVASYEVTDAAGPAEEPVVEPVVVNQTTADLMAGLEPSAVYREGEAAYFARDYDLAAEIFAEYTGRRPANAWGHYMHGLSLWKAGDAEAAAVSLEAALEVKPDHVKSLLNLARVNLELDRPEAALAGAEQALLVEPENADGYRVLGRAYHALDRRDEAVDAYRQALSLHGDDAWSLNNLGLVLLEQDRAMDALPALARAVSLESEQAVFRNNLGMALERAGCTAQAAEAYAQAVEINGYDKAAVSLARVDAVLEAGGAQGGTVDLAALAESFQTQPRIAAESAGNMEVVNHAPGATTSAVPDSAVTANTEVALSGQR
ncbi:MAG TPA: tetratricopeptide repeat protein [Candidatus Krumholzibacteria bacterium]|nr:tetratricopeptide repeat protein [Candidatus Krumholzibacteria bacterium]HRX51834.1 tetratricopeptide repeat protein [Candidatus Krumholzibacteria bacterium]